MTDTDTLAHIEAVLAAQRKRGPVTASAEIDGQYFDFIRIEDVALERATYPEALAVVRDVKDDHHEYHGATLHECPHKRCRSAAAYLSAARDATEAGS